MGQHEPPVKSVLQESTERFRSNLYTKVTEYPIDMSDFVPPIVYDNKNGIAENLNDREIGGVPNLDFLNINLSKSSIQKFDQLVRIYNTTPIFLLNELHFNINDKANLTPAGF